jgi:DNA (cytosine-5)-methyltransferase 1
LESAEYAVGAVDLCAACVGAPHIRQRLYWVAESEGEGRRRRSEVANGSQEPRRPSPQVRANAWPDGYGNSSTEPVSNVLQALNGAANRMGRLRGYGNAIVAPVAQAFIEAYLNG